jgi:RimJ/RimL family protein N-acetyltransferase
MEKFSDFHWWKAAEIQKIWPEMFLKAREPFCVSACAHFLRMSYLFDKMWVLSAGRAAVSALLFQSGRTLYPVFGGHVSMRLPVFMHRILRNSNIHAVQGLLRDTALLEELLLPLAFIARERIDFDLMNLDSGEQLRALTKPPAAINFRVPTSADIASLVPLQAAYQKEEVLQAGALYSPALCRYQTEYIVRNEKILIACNRGRIIGKINTNAQSYSRYQLGGVYVEPAYRNCGVASAMTNVFCRLLLAEGKALTLFVKKNNLAAIRVYQKTGFTKTADYRIVYV